MRDNLSEFQELLNLANHPLTTVAHPACSLPAIAHKLSRPSTVLRTRTMPAYFAKAVRE